MSAFIERRNEDALILGLEPSVGFENSLLEDLLGRGVGVEGLTFLDADGLERIDHGLVAGQPGLYLDDAIERLKETHVVGNGGVEDYVDGVDELRVRRMRGLRERVDLDPFAVGDCSRDISVTAALQIRTKQRIALVGRGWHGDVSGGNLVFVAGRQDQVLAAFSFVDAGGADVLDGGLPAVVH